LIDLGPGPTLLARAVIPEPSFWSPDVPSIYDVTVKLRRGDEVVATARHEIGLRNFGIRRQYFVLEGKRWTLRGVASHSTIAKLPGDGQDAAGAYVADDGDAEALPEASRWGALAVVFVGDDHQRQTAHRLRDLANHPAVAIAALDGSLPDDFNKS